MFSSEIDFLKYFKDKYKNQVKNLWRKIKMKSEKKELIKNFKVLIEDLLDNYEKYTDKEKAQVKEIFEKASELNVILDKYDIEYKFDWTEYLSACSAYFDTVR